MTKPKVEPCILSLSVRSPSEFLTWWLLTTLWTTVSVALFSISHCVTWSKLVGRWEGGPEQWEALFCLYSSLIEVQTLLWSLSVSLSLTLCLFSSIEFFILFRVFISDPLISYASPTIKKEKEDKSVLLFFSAVIKSIKHLKKATLASLSFCVSFLLV